MLKRHTLLSATIAATILLNIPTAHAMKIIPSRLVIKPDQKVEYIYILNDSQVEKSYVFGWKHLAMSKGGDILNLDEVGLDKAPDYKSADSITRYSPRRTTLKPGEKQRISLLVRRSPDLEHGEYRSHFVVTPQPRASGQEQQTPGQDLSVGVEMLISRAFPIYILNGETNASLKINSATLTRNTDPRKTTSAPPYYININVQKTGNRSVIGEANAYCGDTKITKVPNIFVVYAEGEHRQEQVAAFPPKGGCKEAMSVVVTGHGNDVLAGQTLDEILVSQ